MRKAFLVATLCSLVGSAALGIGIFLFGEFGDTQQNLLLTTLAVGGFSLTALASTTRSLSWWLWPLRPMGVATSVVALGVSLVLIWELVANDEVVWKAFGTLGVLAFTSAHLSLLASFTARNNVVWAWRSGAMLIAVGAAYLVVGALWGHIETEEREFYFRWLGVAAILDVLGTVGLYPLSRLVKSSDGPISAPRKPKGQRLSPSR